MFDSSDRVTFSGGILPLLAACPSIVELTLNELDEVDLLAILTIAPALSSLCCVGITAFSESYSTPTTLTASCSLKQLLVLPFGDNDLTSTQLTRLLKLCPNITKIHLNNIQVIDSTSLDAVLASNPLQYLSQAYFTDCNSIDAEFVTSLLSRPSDLTLLKLVDCRGLATADVQDFVNCIQDNNFDASLEIDSFCYPPR